MSAKRAVLLTLLFLSWAALPSPSQTASDNKDQIELHLRMAQRYLGEQKPELAIPELEKVVALDPGNVDVRANLGVLLFFRGDYEGAAPQLRAAVGMKPDLWKIQALLGLAEGRLHDNSASRLDLEAAFPHLTEAAFQLDVGKALIDNYTATGDLEKAADMALNLLTSRPTDTSLIYLSYRLYSDLASRAMLTLALAAPESAEMHQVMAHELAQHGDNAAAIANFRTAIRINPKLSGAHTELGVLLYNSSDVKLQAGAQAEFEAALAVNPQDERAELWLGIMMEKNGDLKSAYADDSRAVQLNPKDSDARAELAKVLVEMNRREQARQMLERAIQIDPTNYTAHYRLANLYRQENRVDDAKKELAEYSKYKKMSEKLEQIFHDMRVTSGQQRQTDNDARDEPNDVH